MTSARIPLVVVLATLIFLVGCREENQPEDPVASVLTLSVQPGSEVYLDGEAIDVAKLELTLRAKAKAHTTYVVYDIAPDAPAATFQEVFRHVRNAGVAGVRFASEDGAHVFHRPALAAR